MYWTDFYAGSTPPVDSSGSIAALMSSLTDASPQRAAALASLRLSAATLAATPDPYNFSGSLASPQREWALTSAALLNARGDYRETLYGAFVPEAASSYYPALSTGVVPDPSAGGAFGYTILHNTSAIHGAPTFVNVINSALYKRVAGSSASITARTHPLPVTSAERITTTGTTSSTVATIVVIAFSFSERRGVVLRPSCGAVVVAECILLTPPPLIVPASVASYVVRCANGAQDGHSIPAPGTCCISSTTAAQRARVGHQGSAAPCWPVHSGLVRLGGLLLLLLREGFEARCPLPPSPAAAGLLRSPLTT